MNIKTVALQLVSGLTGIFAGAFILFTPWDIGGGQYAVLGVVLVFAGVILAGVQDRPWAVVFGLIGLGAYFMARAAGALDFPYLKYFTGVPALILGNVILFRLYLQIFDKPKPGKQN